MNLLEEKKQLVPSETGKAKAHRIMLSGMTPQEKIDYSALVEHLGGKVFDAQHFTPQCTHVVVGNPSR